MRKKKGLAGLLALCLSVALCAAGASSALAYNDYTPSEWKDVTDSERVVATRNKPMTVSTGLDKDGLPIMAEMNGGARIDNSHHMWFSVTSGTVPQMSFGISCINSGSDAVTFGVTTPVDETYFQIDMGQRYLLDEVKYSPFGMSIPNWAIRTFYNVRILSSLDGVNFTPVYTAQTVTIGEDTTMINPDIHCITLSENAADEAFRIQPFSARYLRFGGNKSDVEEASVYTFEASGYAQSQVQDNNAPVSSLTEGVHDGAQTVELSAPAGFSYEGIYYTTDGTAPVPGAANTRLYTGVFEIGEQDTCAVLRTVGKFADGRLSDIGEYTYRFAPGGYRMVNENKKLGFQAATINNDGTEMPALFDANSGLPLPATDSLVTSVTTTGASRAQFGVSIFQTYPGFDHLPNVTEVSPVEDEYFLMDLEQVCWIDKIAYAPFGMEREDFPFFTYYNVSVETSVDGITWTELYRKDVIERNGYVCEEVPGVILTADGKPDYRISPVEARYVRFTGSRNVNDSIFSSEVYKFFVYGASFTNGVPEAPAIQNVIDPALGREIGTLDNKDGAYKTQAEVVSYLAGHADGALTLGGYTLENWTTDVDFAAEWKYADSIVFYALAVSDTDANVYGTAKTFKITNSAPAADYRKLSARVAAVDKPEYTRGNYFKQYLDTFNAKLSEARTVLGAASESDLKSEKQEGIDAALAALNTAYDALLEHERADTGELIFAYNRAANLTETTYTSASWAAVAEQLAAVRMLLGEDLTGELETSKQGEADALTAALTAAENALVARATAAEKQELGISDRITEGGNIPAERYTNASYAPFKTLLDSLTAANADNADISAEALEKLAAEYDAALSGLVKLGDKTALTARYDELKDTAAAGYTAASFRAFSSALTDAEEILADSQATETQVAEALAGLNDAYSGLVALGNKAALNDKIAEAEAEKAAAYTTSSWTAFASALDAAKTVAGKAEALQEELDAALEALEQAMDALVARGNKTELAAAIGREVSESGYTALSYALYLAALEDASAVNNNLDAIQSEVDAALTALDAAYAALVKLGDKTALGAAIDAAKSLSESEYTKESFAELLNKLAEAEQVFANPEASETEVNAAEQALTSATNALAKAEAPGSDGCGCGGEGSAAAALTLLAAAAAIVFGKRLMIK